MTLIVFNKQYFAPDWIAPIWDFVLGWSFTADLKCKELESLNSVLSHHGGSSWDSCTYLCI